MSESVLENKTNLPEGWIESTLDEIAIKLTAGGTPSTKIKKYYYNGTIPFVRIDDITDNYKYLDKTRDFITRDGLENSSAWIIPKNSVLYSIYASYGIPIINRLPVSTSQAIIAYVLPKYGIKLEFIYYFLDFIKSSLIPKGTTQKNLSAKIVRNLIIKIPPSNEQERIVEKIEELISLHDNYKKQLNIIQKKISTLLSSVFQTRLTGTNIPIQNQDYIETFSYLKNFSNPQKKYLKEITPEDIENLSNIPSNWLWVRLGSICSIKDVDHKMPKAVKTGVDFVSTTDFRDDGTIDFKNTKKISYVDFKKNTKKIFPKKGDFLFSRYGTLGKVIRVPDKEFGLSYSIAVIRPFFKETDYDWMHFILQSTFVLHQAIKGDQSSGMADLGLITMRNFLIPLPPSNIQKIIADSSDDHIAHLQHELKQFQQNLKLADNLKIMILKQAFDGKLVPQDPDDESAEIILQNIKKEKEQLKQKEKAKKWKKNDR